MPETWPVTMEDLPKRSRTELALLISLAVVMVGGMALIGFVNGW